MHHEPLQAQNITLNAPVNTWTVPQASPQPSPQCTSRHSLLEQTAEGALSAGSVPAGARLSAAASPAAAFQLTERSPQPAAAVRGWPVCLAADLL